MSAKKIKTILISLRLSPAQLKDLRTLAAGLGLNPQSFLRMLLQRAKSEAAGAEEAHRRVRQPGGAVGLPRAGAGGSGGMLTGSVAEEPK